MFFSSHLFKKELSYLTDEQREHIARICNDIVNKNGIVCWGRGFKDNTIRDFSSLKLPTSTHVGIVIGLKEMAIFEPDETPIKRDMPEEVEEFSKDDIISQLAKEVKAARALIASRPAPKGPQ